MKMYQDEAMGKLEDLARQIESETGKRVVVIGQEDNAGPHQNETYRAYMNTEFDKRGWQYRPQPPNSPTTNVRDLGLFSSLAKSVSRIQARSFGLHYLQGE